MNPLFNSSLAIIFIICGIAATFIMLELRGAPKERSINANLIKLHKILGWIFITVFLFMILVMVKKVSGYNEEISSRISFHIILALSLAPLLAVKLIIARRYPRLSPNLITFGPAVLIFSVALSSVTAGYYFMHSSDLKYVSLAEFDAAILDANLGRQIINQKCNKCHSLERVYRASKNEDEWTATINKMASLDVPNISSFDIKQSIHFLANRENPANNNKTNKISGKIIMETKCTACHSLDRILHANKSKEEWKNTIELMISRSGDSDYLTTQEQKKLIEYLINR